MLPFKHVWWVFSWTKSILSITIKNNEYNPPKWHQGLWTVTGKAEISSMVLIWKDLRTLVPLWFSVACEQGPLFHMLFRYIRNRHLFPYLDILIVLRQEHYQHPPESCHDRYADLWYLVRELFLLWGGILWALVFIDCKVILRTHDLACSINYFVRDSCKPTSPNKILWQNLCWENNKNTY